MADTEIQANQPREARSSLRGLHLANGVLIAASLYSFAWCLFSILNHKALYLRAGPALGALASALALTVRPAVRMTMMSLLVGAGVGIYATELVAMVIIDADRSEREAVRTDAVRHGRPYDGRAKIDVIMGLRSQGVPAYPPFYPYLTFAQPLNVDGVPTIPLGSVSHIMTVCCNEGGQWLTYPTDEYGFANPPGLWKQAPLDVAIVGASWATGECVPIADSIASQLRERYPKTVSLGAGGNGPFLELASIREYLPALRPARIIWIFAENHTPEIMAKERSVPLLRYLDESFQQRLMERQPGVERAVRHYLEDATEAELDPKRPSMKVTAFQLATLSRVRIAVFDLAARFRPPEADRLDGALYRQVLRRGQQIVGGWGGKITIVYIPDMRRYPGVRGYSPAWRRACEKTRASVLAAAGSLGIPVIDITPRFPGFPPSQQAQYDKYFYPYEAHFKPEGYRMMDRAILEEFR